LNSPSVIAIKHGSITLGNMPVNYSYLSDLSITVTLTRSSADADKPARRV